jgi:hypothetical protein
VLLMLRGAGFSATEESAVDLLVDITADRLTKLGTTLRQLADARARADLAATPGMLRASDGDPPPAVVGECIGRLGVSWARLAVFTAAAAGDKAEQTHENKRHCWVER